MITKARENNEAGDWAEAKNYYHIALGRYYYSLYQKVLHINTSKNLNLDSGLRRVKDTHKEFIKRFISYFQVALSPQDTVDLTCLNNLRKLRNKEEYNAARVVNNTNYNSSVKDPFIKIDRILEDLIRR